MPTKQKYETRPLETWAKAKEMRARFEQDVRDSADQNMLLAQGGMWAIWAFAFPALRVVEDNPLGSMIQFQSSRFARECRGAGEALGWGREICGYQLNCWGAMYLNRQIDGSKFPMRDMVIPMPDPCDQHTKRGQAPMDHSNIPRWQSDWPIYTGPDDPDRDGPMIENRVKCVLDQIADVERVTGQRCDDEKLVQVMQEMWTYNAYKRDICAMMAHVPAPLSQKDLYTFYTLGGLTLTDPDETVALWKMLHDEIKWRCDNNIAAVGNERYRWMETHPPPWHFLKYYRYMEQYGAVCIGSQYTHGTGYEWKPDGSWGRTPTPMELGMPLKTRDDAIRAFYASARGASMKVDEILRPAESLQDFARAFHCDGAILPLWRGGVGCTYARKDQGRYLTDVGVRVLHYEGSQPGDRTDIDEVRFLDQLDIWMESQGLKKLEE